MSRGPEGKIQDAVIKYAREEHGALCKKNEVGRYFTGSGWPDYTIFTTNGKVFLVEFKAPGGKLTPLQARVHEELKGRDQRVYVVRSVADGKRVIDEECV